jgi:hypothetical protein
MTATRRLSTLLAALTAGIMLIAANPAAAGLADRAEPAITGEIVSIPVKEPRATTAVAAIQADVEEVAEVAEKPAVKRAASTAKPGLSRRAEHAAKKEYRPRPHISAAPVRAAAVTLRPAFGASCHRR